MRSSLRNRLRSFRAAQEGVAATETALALPFLFALGAGMLEFGAVFYNTQLIQTGVRDAGRYLSRAADLPASEESARRLAVTGSIEPGKAARVKWWKTDQIQIAYETHANPRDAVSGLRNYRGDDTVTVVRVSTSVAYESLGLLSFVGLGKLTIAAAHEERYVGQ